MECILSDRLSSHILLPTLRHLVGIGLGWKTFNFEGWLRQKAVV
jgi:hypothetical protein